MVMDSMKPGMASWFSVTSPLPASVETTLPRSGYTLMFGLKDGASAPGAADRHPASATRARSKKERLRITDQFTTGSRP
jgi:hypothetical protein